MRIIVVGSGAGGATAARELAGRGHKVIILEAGSPVRPLSRRLGWTEPMRRLGLLRSTRTISRLFPAIRTVDGGDVVLVRAVATGGCTSVSCGNLVRAEVGLDGLGLDLTPEFEEIEGLLGPRPFPQRRWRPTTLAMFEAARSMGLDSHPTPKCVDASKCISCGLCEVGCSTGARWDSSRLLSDALAKGAKLVTGSPVGQVIVDEGKTIGVAIGQGRSERLLGADAVVLAAGGMGTAQVLKASGLPSKDRLWGDLVLTIGGVKKGSRQLREPPMVWYARRDNYILSPYIDILSHWFHRPWRDTSIDDRVGIMVKLGESESGAVAADGTVVKRVTNEDRAKLEEGAALAEEIMRGAGVSGPFVPGMLHAGHLGGTVPLSPQDVPGMHPAGLPDNLWVADLSLVPRSQGLPTILLTSAVALRVARAMPDGLAKR